MYTLPSFPHFSSIFVYVFIKIINTFNHMVYISEYQPTSLGQSNQTQFSAILCHQRPRCENLSKYIPLFFPQLFMISMIFLKLEII